MLAHRLDENAVAIGLLDGSSMAHNCSLRDWREDRDVHEPPPLTDGVR